MDTQELLHRLLAKMDKNQAKSDAARKADKEETKADKEEMLVEIKADRKAYREDLKEMRAIKVLVGRLEGRP
jgi:hypothetical protein